RLLGETLQVRFTEPAKPALPVIVMVEVADCPAEGMVTDVGLAAMPKSGGVMFRKVNRPPTGSQCKPPRPIRTSGALSLLKSAVARKEIGTSRVAVTRTGAPKVPSPFPSNTFSWAPIPSGTAIEIRSKAPSPLTSTTPATVTNDGDVKGASVLNVPCPFPRKTCNWVPLDPTRSIFSSPFRSAAKETLDLESTFKK